MKRLRDFGVTLCLSSCAWCLGVESAPLPAAELQFERTVIDPDFPGGYQVEVADVNGDKKPDIVAIGGGTCAWYENPTWTKRVVTTPEQTPGIISSATIDVNGDRKAEIAIAYEFAMNEPTKGKVVLAIQGATVNDPWKLTPIADVGSAHRLRWGDFDGDKHPDLAVAPIFGPGAEAPDYNQSPARFLVVFTGEARGGKSASGVKATRPVLHAIAVLDIDRDGRSEVLTADNLGVAWITAPRDRAATGWQVQLLAKGGEGEAPKRGSSEVHLGNLADGRWFLATIDPWHGHEVAVRLAERPASLIFGPRTVIDDTLADGHALWVADVDGDGNDEVFAGHRGQDHRVSAYTYDGKSWTRTVVDTEVAAQDLRGGDLDGDRVPDVVAIGGKTHNIVWYKPKRTKEQ